MAEDKTFCGNCKKSIPSVNFVMHNMHCARNITLCDICEEPVPRTEMESHKSEFHSLKDCESCGEKLDVSQLTDHKENSCPMRRVNCAICELELIAPEIPEHENYCGSRTERCEECGEYVMLKYQRLHLESNHGFLKLDDEPGPTPSWQNNDKVAVNGPFNNDLRFSSWKPSNNSAAFAAARVPNFVSPSTSKRTNDMPQVNSILPSHASKSVYKPSIMGDMDRLKDYAVGDLIDVAALLNDRLNLAKPPSYSRLSSSSHSIGEEDLVALPCEFCEALVPANQLILHQTACRPDLARYEEPAAASTLNGHSSSASSSILANPTRMNSLEPSYKIHNNLTIGTPRQDFNSIAALDETLLPCEFCHESFSVSKLYEHQTMCTQSWSNGLNGRQDVTYSFNGRPNSIDPATLYSLPKSISDYKTIGKNAETGMCKSVHSDDLNAVTNKQHIAHRLPGELKTAQRRARDARRHSLEKEWLLPVQPSVRPTVATTTARHPDPNEFEDDEGRQALLKQAEMMDQISCQLRLKKEPFNSQRNHVYTELPAFVPRNRKQPNHFTNLPSSSHNPGSTYSSAGSGYSQSGRGGSRTTGAIPKQKAGTSKSPITY